mmetsp:Transcript_28009/g.41882  ORF Transcript_28009/g.41882 Transcript_28009/m.41882 type:complete len:91 (+) Transcript_28009:179-451(+)
MILLENLIVCRGHYHLISRLLVDCCVMMMMMKKVSARMMYVAIEKRDNIITPYDKKKAAEDTPFRMDHAHKCMSVKWSTGQGRKGSLLRQ